MGLSLLRTFIVCIRGSWSGEYNILAVWGMDIGAAGRVVDIDQKLS